MGERLNGIQEVVGSIPSGSTHVKYFVYVLYSESSDQYYVGHTEDIDRRLNQHNSGYSKSTKAGIPWKLKYENIFSSRKDAVKRENEIKKKKSRKYIQWIIENAE